MEFYTYDDIESLIPAGKSIAYMAKRVLKNDDIEWFYYHTYTINYLIYSIVVSTKGDIIFTVTNSEIYMCKKMDLDKFEKELSSYDKMFISKLRLTLKAMGIIDIYIQNRAMEYKIKLSGENCRDLIFSDTLIKSFYKLEDMVLKRLEELNRIEKND
jgi:hypothetical protein